jgi:hypothetical protein
MKFEISLQIFEKYSDIKFHENPYLGTVLFYSDGQTDARTDITKVIVAFRNFANAPKNCCLEGVVQDLHSVVRTNSRYNSLELFNIIHVSTDTYNGSI